MFRRSSLRDAAAPTRRLTSPFRADERFFSTIFLAQCVHFVLSPFSVSFTRRDWRSCFSPFCSFSPSLRPARKHLRNSFLRQICPRCHTTDSSPVSYALLNHGSFPVVLISFFVPQLHRSASPSPLSSAASTPPAVLIPPLHGREIRDTKSMRTRNGRTLLATAAENGVLAVSECTFPLSSFTFNERV